VWTVPIVSAQSTALQPVSDLVIQIGSNGNDVILIWLRPQLVDSFQIHAGDSANFVVGVSNRIGKTADTTFTHVNGLVGTTKRFYAVVTSVSMVLVPAGSYTMGSTVVGGDAIPEHTVTMPAFYIDVFEVTNGQYKAFCDATGRAYPEDPGFSGMDNYFTHPTLSHYPVVNVSWQDAKDYCKWRGPGFRLPTEAEWERAAKGNVGNRRWPWGDTWVAANGNIAPRNADGYDNTAPAGAFPGGVSPAGCYEMAGNVQEWCEDNWHDNYIGVPSDGSPWIDFPRDSTRVLRGGTWLGSSANARCADRASADTSTKNTFSGFRCAKYVTNQPPRPLGYTWPENGAVDQSLRSWLVWDCIDLDGDSLTYDLYFDTDPSPRILQMGRTNTAYYLNTLNSNQTYYWRVVAHDSYGNTTTGPTWSFTTMTVPDGMVDVRAGFFQMGGGFSGDPEYPMHGVVLQTYFIDLHEVTNAQYRAFCDATLRDYPEDPGFSGMSNYFTAGVYANYPVLNVSWQDAQEYCLWRGPGYRLPTEAEWERAARGYQDHRNYPWGWLWNPAWANSIDPSDAYDRTSPVGAFPDGISPTGCYDMAGNVFEWCQDDDHDNYVGAPTDGSAWRDYPRGARRIVRGGGWNAPWPFLQCTERGSFPPDTRMNYVGFRCAKAPVNHAPSAPGHPSPQNNATEQPVNVQLTWKCTDDDFDILTYDVYFGTALNPPLRRSGQFDEFYIPAQLEFEQTYYWRIVVHDNSGESISSPIWNFSTLTPPAGMVGVPTTSYLMGSTEGGNPSIPVHTVTVPEFYIDQYEVTNAQYKLFCDLTNRFYPPDPGFDEMPNYFTNAAYAYYPVVNVTWQDAQDYCTWRGAGYRLPSEAEWELAAKGSSDNRSWPWGDIWIASNANICCANPDGYIHTSPIGTYPYGISPFGCYDMSGNVIEWCQDDPHNNYEGAPTDGSAWIDNPPSNYKIIRGGSFSHNQDGSRCIDRGLYPTNGLGSHLGFRCVKNP
jgi:formylglycine-generating enzyme required for sulfatase activity